MTHSVALSILAYLLLVRLYGGDETLSKEWSLFKLKERFIGEITQDAVMRTKYKSPLKGDGIPVMGWYVLRRCFGLLSNACLDFPPLIYGDLY